MEETKLAKTMKYELIRSKITLLVLGGVLGGSELIFLLGLMSDSGSLTGLGILFLTMSAAVGYFTIWLLGLISFSKDLRQKSGYMIFLTPVSPYKIIIAKLLVGMIELFATAAAIIALATLDLAMLTNKYEQVQMLRSLSRIMGVAENNLAGVFVALLLTYAVSVLALYAIAYFASAFAAMLTSSKGGQKGLTVVLIIVILIIYGAIRIALTGEEIVFYSTVWERVKTEIPATIFSFLIAAAFTFLTGHLVDKKVSL